MNDPKKMAQDLPLNPGIYQMLDSSGTILYIGKAKQLRKRVLSYFNKNQKDVKTKTLVKHVKKIDFIVTHTEQEALVLENQLIKHHKPRYNIQLKDDKSYPYIKITPEYFPRILVTRHKRADGGQYFGPFPAMGSSRKLIQTLLDIFPLRDCKQKISLTTIEAKCLQVDIGKCLGPCIYKDIRSTYDEAVNDLALFLTGKNKSLIKKLEQRMKDKSLALDFEAAAKLRDAIQRLSDIHQKQNVCLDESLNIDILVAQAYENTLYFLYQKINEGKLIAQRGLFVESFQNKEKEALFIETLSRLFPDQEIPTHFICNAMLAEFKPILKNLNIQSKFRIPQRGLKVDLIDKAILNAKVALNRVSRPKYEGTVLELLAKYLHIKHPLDLIFGFDISHFYAQDIVASAVCFKEGIAYKEAYRHFSIKSVNNNKSDDPKSIYEAVLRRLNLAQKENLIPDLLLIDGGKSQLNAAYQALKDSALASKNISVISLAKKEELIYLVDQKEALDLAAQDPALKLLQAIRDESHRFANRLQKIKRNKRFF